MTLALLWTGWACIDEQPTGIRDDLLDPPRPSLAVTYGSPVSVTDIVELQPLPGASDVEPRAMSSFGVVVGVSGNRPVVWEDGVPIELPMPAGATSASPNSINDAGQIAGTAQVGGMNRAVLWDDGSVIEIGALAGHQESFGQDVTDGGHVVGVSSNGSQPRAGFVWRNGVMTALPPIPGDEITDAVAGSASGLVIGTSSNIYEEPADPRDERRFVVWQDGVIVWTQSEPSDPHPVPDGNEVWLDIADSDDAYFVNTDVGGVWRWRQGDADLWPPGRPMPST